MYIISATLQAETDLVDVQVQQIFKNVAKGQFVMPANLSIEVQTLICSLLTVHPAERLGANNGVQDIWEHAWFSNVDCEGIRNRTVRAPHLPKLQACSPCTATHDDVLAAMCHKDT